jgi:hypothetical protein
LYNHVVYALVPDTQPERAGARKAFEKAVRFTCAPAFKTGEIND